MIEFIKKDLPVCLGPPIERIEIGGLRLRIKLIPSE
jgi:hypothetical protein